MGKHTKLKAADLSAMPDDLLDEVEGGLRTAFRAAEASIQSGDAAPQIIREMAATGRTLISLAAERRAREKAQRYNARNVPREVVMAYLREQAEEERNRIMREMQRWAAGGGVLG